jgi:uncharacterized protein with von Willebrand factor type A (vWA) domain
MLTTASNSTTDLGAVLRARLVGFPGFLRANGYAVGGNDAVGLLDTVAQGEILDRQVLRWNVKALLCGRAEEWRRFDDLFEAYFRPPNKRLVVAGGVAATRARERSAVPTGGAEGEPPVEGTGRAASGDGEAGSARYAASRAEATGSTDFSELARTEHTHDVEALMRRFARRLKHVRLRREARFDRGRRLDLQGTIRRSVAQGGTPLRLAWKDYRRVRPRLVLLLDVSRSMSAYSFFYLRLARALCGELADTHCFLFHTRITGVGEALRDPDPWRSQERLHVLAVGWGGGTRIGECLRDFNRVKGARLIHSRTAVVIVSDGYDTGEPEVLAGALATLRRRSRRLVWLNPLLAQRGYRPESRAMRAALPYLDLLAPGADLAGLERVLPQVIEALG